MASELSVILLNCTSYEESIRAEAEAQDQQIKESNVVEYLVLLMEIMGSSDFPVLARSMAIIRAWQLFPEELSDLPSEADHPFDVLTRNVIESLLQISYKLLSCQETQIAHLAGTLYGRIAALEIHYNPQNSIFAQLSTDFNNATTLSVIEPLSVALQKVCSSTVLEAEEVPQLMESVLSHINENSDLAIANESVSVLARLIISLQEYLEDQESCSVLLNTLLQLTSIDGIERAVFDCWIEISKIAPNLILMFEQVLIPTILGVLASEESPQETLFRACNLLRKLAAAEAQNEDEEEISNQVLANYESIITVLINLVSQGVLETDNDESGLSIADEAKHTIPRVLRVCETEHIEALESFVMSIATSNEIGYVYAVLCLLSSMISASEDPCVANQFFETLLAQAQSEHPLIRKQAIICLRRGINKLIVSANDERIAFLQQFVPQLHQLSSYVTDVPVVGFQVMKLMAAMVKIPNFSHTSEYINALYPIAVEMRYLYSKDPFSPINEIIDEGEHDAVVKSIDHALELYNSAVTQAQFSWLIVNLSETIQAYFIRFGEEINSYVEPFCTLLLQVACSESSYASDALLPLGIIAQRCPTIFAPFAEQALSIFLNGLQSIEYPEILYNSTYGLDFIIRGGFDLSQHIETILNLLLEIIKDFNQEPKNRRAAVQTISSLAEISPQLYSPYSQQVMNLIRAFCDGLQTQLDFDEMEAQLMMNALGCCILNTIKAVGINEGTKFVDMAFNIFAHVAELEGTISRLSDTTLALMYFVAVNYKNQFLECIQDDEDVGDYIVSLTNYPDKTERAKQILDALGYQ